MSVYTIYPKNTDWGSFDIEADRHRFDYARDTLTLFKGDESLEQGSVVATFNKYDIIGFIIHAPAAKVAYDNVLPFPDRINQPDSVRTFAMAEHPSAVRL